MADTVLPESGGGKIILRVKSEVGATIKASLNGKTFQGTVGDSGVVDIKLRELGTYKIEGTKNDLSYEQNLNVYHYGITEYVALFKKDFSSCTPEEILSIADAGLAPKYWQIGDTHSITLTTQELITVKILDFNHDVATDGETLLPLTLGMSDCLKTTYNMNTANNNTGGWEKCNFRNNTIPGLLATFPEEWRNIMAECQKKTGIGSNNKVDLVTTNDTLWLMSLNESFGTNNGYGTPNEGTHYPVYTNDASRIKKVNGTASVYYGRSPITTSDGSTTAKTFGGVANAGNGYYGISGSVFRQASWKAGISLCFCVGGKKNV